MDKYLHKLAYRIIISSRHPVHHSVSFHADTFSTHKKPEQLWFMATTMKPTTLFT